jgi:hypothetical protein
MAELRPVGGDRADGVVRVEREHDLESLGLEEELGELGRVGVALGEQDHDTCPGLASGRREVAGDASEHAVGIARRDPLANAVGHEAETLDVHPRVQAVATCAPNRLHDAVPLLPGTKRGRRDPHHARDGPDAVGGDFGHDGLSIPRPA